MVILLINTNQYEGVVTMPLSLAEILFCSLRWPVMGFITKRERIRNNKPADSIMK
jgi:hypothetical protein